MSLKSRLEDLLRQKNEGEITSEQYELRKSAFVRYVAESWVSSGSVARKQTTVVQGVVTDTWRREIGYSQSWTASWFCFSIRPGCNWQMENLAVSSWEIA